jgi:hypothetical protein
MRHEPLLIILSRRTGNKERHRPKSMFRPLSARALADAFVTFALKPDGTIEQMKMAAVSRLADFSFDWYLLFTPVSKKSDQSCATRVPTASSSKS